MIIPGLQKVSEPAVKNEFGLWIFEKHSSTWLYPFCSACGEPYVGKPTNYCPSCGAEMLNRFDACKHFERVIEEYNQKTLNQKELEEDSNG